MQAIAYDDMQGVSYEQFPIGSRVSIKGGTVVLQDFILFRWVKSLIVFEIVHKSLSGRYELVAPGFGLLGSDDQYGNGRLFVSAKDLSLVEAP